MRNIDGLNPVLLYPNNLELEVNGVRVVSLTFGLSLYTDVPFSSIPKAVLECFDRFLQLCPPDRLKFYATENMRRHKPVTNRTLNMLNMWLKPGAPPREYICIELHDGEDFNWAPKFKFRVFGGEEGSSHRATNDANLIRMAFPPEWGIERTEEMLELAIDLCGMLPFRSGHAGFVFECSRYSEKTAQTYALAKSMRHRGIDIADDVEDTITVGQDGVKGVGWLTMLDDRWVRQLGGEGTMRASLSDNIEIIQVPGGLILKAGPMPAIGDTNRRDFLPEYQQVYKLIAPLVEVTFDRSAAFAIEGPDPVEQTRAWRRRFEDE